MQSFFIFISCERGQTNNVGRRIVKEVPGVKEVSSISGKWDLLVQLNVDERQNVGELVNDRLAAIDGIRKTKTLVSYYVYNPEDVFF